MAIDYVTDIRPLYAADVGTDADYTGRVDADRRDEVSEQDILTTLAVVEAHIRLLRDRDEARLLHYALSRLITGAGSGGFVFEDLAVEVVGSVVNPVFTIGDDIEVVDAAGANIVTAVATGTTLAQVVIDLNAAAAGALGVAGIVASARGGRLVLTQDDGSLTASANRRYGPGFGIGTAGANNNVTRLAGLEYGQYKNVLDELADKVRDDALDHFNREAREATLDDYFRRDPQRA